MNTELPPPAHNAMPSASLFDVATAMSRALLASGQRQTPDCLREFIDHMPWDEFSEGELNQINRIAMECAARVRKWHGFRRQAVLEQRAAENQACPDLSREEIENQMTKEMVLPKGHNHGD